MQCGLNGSEVEGIEYKNYFPFINNDGTTNFGDVQEIKFWGIVSNNTISPSDSFGTLLNPFTKNQYYQYNNYNYNYIPSPFTKYMNKNQLFFTENPDTEHPSCLLNFDGKNETEKMLNQLNNNIGNDEWKSNETIENINDTTHSPAIQTTWMYCVKEGYENNPIFGQGCWYIPTITELIILMGYRQAINNSLFQIQNTYGIRITNLGNTSNSWSSNRYSTNLTLIFYHQSGQINRYNGYCSTRTMILV